MDERSDAELVALARSGDRRAFGDLVERHQAMAKRVARGVVAIEDVARELANEAMLQALPAGPEDRLLLYRIHDGRSPVRGSAVRRSRP